MKCFRPFRLALSTFVGVSLLLPSASQSASILLQLEESTDLKNWTQVPVNALTPTGNGAFIEHTVGDKTFYRLKIDDAKEGGTVSILPLREAPAQAIDIALGLLRDFQTPGKGDEGIDTEGNWSDVELGPVCYPIYDPSYEGGKAPAYLEFKVVKRKAKLSTDPAASKFGLSVPDESEDGAGFGHILVSLTQGDLPAVQFGDVGPTPVERLLRKVHTSGVIKPIRFDDGLLVVEDAEGRILGSSGNVPFLIDPKILDLAGKELAGEANEKGEQGDRSPEFSTRSYESYAEFKKDFVSNPLFRKLRALRAQQAKSEWNVIQGVQPSVIKLKVHSETLILRGTKIKSFGLDNPDLVALKPSTAGGLTALGLSAGGTVLNVVYSDDTTDRLLIVVSGPNTGAQLNTSSTGWSDWSYWYAGNWGDQRRYRQFSNDPQMCPSGASGCGPTAWSMLYGWWDRKGSPRLLKNFSFADSPLYNDDSVRDCDRYVFNQLGTFCVSGQAATWPWAMKDGYHWAGARGAGYNISWSWGVPYLSPGSMGTARDSVKAGRPAIIGLGFYWHYPLAYGYASRTYEFLGITWDTQRWFKCNMGWGGSSPEWHSASSVWFGTNGRFW